jgi:hypothetical protein
MPHRTLPDRFTSRSDNCSFGLNSIGVRFFFFFSTKLLSRGADADAPRVRALAAYKDFLTSWKDADPTSPSCSKPSTRAAMKLAHAQYRGYATVIALLPEGFRDV